MCILWRISKKLKSGDSVRVQPLETHTVWKLAGVRRPIDARSYEGLGWCSQEKSEAPQTYSRGDPPASLLSQTLLSPAELNLAVILKLSSDMPLKFLLWTFSAFFGSVIHVTLQNDVGLESWHSAFYVVFIQMSLYFGLGGIFCLVQESFILENLTALVSLCHQEIIAGFQAALRVY